MDVQSQQIKARERK